MTTPRILGLGLGLAATTLALASLGGDSREGEVHVFAAASLRGVFAEGALGEAPIEGCAFHFAGSSRLAFQIEQGARCSIVVAADRASLDRILRAVPTHARPRVFAHNRLAILVARGQSKRIRRLSDLAKQDLRVVLAAPEVPAGRYARRLLAKAKLSIDVISEEASVSGVVQKVTRGEADAGIAYESDAHAAAGRVDAITVEKASNVQAVYWIAALDEDPRTLAAVEALCGARVRAALQARGFRLP